MNALTSHIFCLAVLGVALGFRHGALYRKSLFNKTSFLDSLQDDWAMMILFGIQIYFQFAAMFATPSPPASTIIMIIIIIQAIINALIFFQYKPKQS